MSAESEVLHALIEDNVDEARQQLRDFLPGELARLKIQAEWLVTLCHDQLRALDKDHTTGEK